jgi:hypothetical protein
VIETDYQYEEGPGEATSTGVFFVYAGLAAYH